MAELRNIRNTGVVVGGDVTRSTISVGRTGSADGTDEAAVLRQLEQLFAELLSEVGQLPAELAGTAAYQAVQLKTEVTAANRDPKRVHAVLNNLMTAVATAAPLAEIVKDIAELVGHLVH